MHKLKSHKHIKGLARIIFGAALLAALVGLGVAISVWKTPTENKESVEMYDAYEGATQPIVIENDDLKLEMDPATTFFTLTVKSSGATWTSNPADADSDSVALPSDIENLKSTLLLTYSTMNGVDTLYNNYKYSIQSQTYKIDKTTDEQGNEAIKVDYAIGNAEKKYIMPVLITVDRMKELTDAMDGSDAKSFTQYYKKYDLDHLKKKDNKDELLAQYPMLADGPIYVLRDGVKDSLKKKLEKMATEAGFTEAEYDEEAALLGEKEEDSKAVFHVSVLYSLKGKDMNVSIPMSEIQYSEDFPLIAINVLPYFGAGTNTEEGFMFVPEGNGAIINFNNNKLSQNSYYTNVYGWDMATNRDALVHDTRSAFGTFGIAKNGNSFICIPEGGECYASIEADIAGRNNTYNHVGADYTILHREQCDVADKYNGKMFLYEEKLPDEVISQRYRFVDSELIKDMALSYGAYLDEAKGLSINTDGTAKTAIDVIGSIDKVQHVAGVPKSKAYTVTSYAQTKEIAQDLNNSGVSGLDVSLLGWADGGVRQQVNRGVKSVKSEGSQKKLKDLAQYCADNNISFNLGAGCEYAMDNKKFDGFVVFRDAATLVNKEKVELYPFSTVSFEKIKSKDAYYLMKPSKIVGQINKYRKQAGKYGAGLTLQDIGSDLSSDFNRKNPVSRQAALDMQLSQLDMALENGVNVSSYVGNDYMLGKSSLIKNMELCGSEYGITDENVPFYTMALHGKVDYTGKPLNLVGDSQEELLRSAQAGASLYYTVMSAQADVLQNSDYTQLFGASYSSLRDSLVETVNNYNDKMMPTRGHGIVDFEKQGNVSITTYDNGVKVYVNFGEVEANVDGTSIAARDFSVTGGNQ